VEGGGNQKRTTTDEGGGGRHLNRSSTSADIEQIFCVSDPEDTLPRIRLSVPENMLRFRAFLRDTSRTPEDVGGGEGCLANGRCQTGGRGPKSQFLLGRL